MWPVLCSLKLVINVLKSVPRRQKVHRLSLCGKRDEAEWVISLRRADNTASSSPLFENCGHTPGKAFFLMSLIMTLRFLSFFSGQADRWRLRDGAHGWHSHEANRLWQRVAALHPRVHIARHIKSFLWLLHKGERDLVQRGNQRRSLLPPSLY